MTTLHPHSSPPRHRRRVRTAGCGRLRWVLLAVAATVALGLVAPGLSSADTRGFDICNLTGGTLALSNRGPFSAGGEGAPPIGSKPALAECDHYELYWVGLSTNHGKAVYAYTPYQGQEIIPALNFDLQVDGVGTPSVNCKNNATDLLLLVGCSAGGGVLVADPAGTVIEIPATRSKDQANVLEQLQKWCNLPITSGGPPDGLGPPVQCHYTTTSETKVDSPAHQLGRALVNNTNKPQHTSVKTTDTVSETNSLQIKVEAGGGIGAIVKASVSAKYGHDWTTEHTFEQEVDVTCPKHHKCWISATAPMLRDTGDFTVTLGGALGSNVNTTWKLRDASFDTPDPNGAGAYSVESRPLTARERATLPRRFTTPDRLRETYALPRAAQRSEIAKPRLVLSIAGPSASPVGQVADHSIALTRTDPRNRLVQRVRNARIVARVDSRRAPRWKQSRRWRWSVRRPIASRRALHLRVKPPRRARGRVCVTVRATARHARGDRARHCHRATAASAPAFAG